MDRYSELERRLGASRARRDEPLERHSTFRIGGPADLLCLPETMDDLCEVVRWVAANGVPWLVIGNGSNLLFPDEGFRGVVIKIRGNTPAPGTLWDLSQEDEHIRAGAGVSLARLAWFAASAGLSGVEFGTGIPGVVGGSIRGNAGAHGSQLGDWVDSIEVVRPPDTVTVLRTDRVGFRYRHTALDAAAIITGAVFRLRPDRPEDIRDRIREFTEYRKQTQPSADQSAGCIFKNPPAASAGQLIDRAGCKGLRIGEAMVSERHANFIINCGQATAADTLRLIDAVRERVLTHAGIVLELEVRILKPEGV
jgi:UDP-N-acetylmuramate dehydrogenase